MSEEILKALMQLFAIIAKQDTGSSSGQKDFINIFLRSQLNELKVNEYLTLYEEFLGPADPVGVEPEKKRTSMKDSVRTVSICKKINKTLTQKQKVVVLIRLYEFICSEESNTAQRLEIIETVSDVFKITTEEKLLIEEFIFQPIPSLSKYPDTLLIHDGERDNTDDNDKSKFVRADGFQGDIRIIKVNSVGLYFLKFQGHSDVHLNGLRIKPQQIYLFPPGGTMGLPRGTVYYSDIVARFNDLRLEKDIAFTAEDISFRFKTGEQALRGINVKEEGGKLIGIMGGSGAGKTTLLNVLSGIEKPSSGSVKINNIDIHDKNKSLDGLIGYISQDDLLFEDLTVFQNLFYNAELCHGKLDTEEIELKTSTTLSGLGLQEAKDIKVGSPLNKMISGGQRKRLNISLELIREPPVLFVDEPTSGLSSRDSENVMDLLKELSLKGKLIFVVIHQPSSDIYKLFDKVIILDKGGYQIYYGNPIEAVMYFKKAANHLNNDIGECESCGTVNPEAIFNIIESKEVDEYGNATANRKVAPEQWSSLYNKIFSAEKEEPKIMPAPSGSFFRPKKIKQYLIFLKRDLVSKISNSQYLIMNFLEAPLLAVILSGLIRFYNTNDDSAYIFRENENIPAYIFISVIVMLFFGLTVSAEEIFRDQKILKREQFLNLSKLSYLLSKICILFFISALQSALFVLAGNFIVGVKGMFWDYWWILFSVSASANVVGLNISSAFNSAVTIYILIPLLIIPQMIMGGAMISYDKINKYLGGGEKVPVIAELMISRWAYEALMVNQFKNNKYEREFYDLDKKISQINYFTAYFLPELVKVNIETKGLVGATDHKKVKEFEKNKNILKVELGKFPEICAKFDLDPNKVVFDNNGLEKIGDVIEEISFTYSDSFNFWDARKDALLKTFIKTNGVEKVNRIKDSYCNDYLADIVNRSLAKKKILRTNEGLIQVVDPIYQVPSEKFISLNEPLYLPEKRMFKTQLSAFIFNILIIWGFSLLGFIALYWEWLKKLLNIDFKHFFPKKNH